MDLRQLRSFVAVAEAGGFSKAAGGLRLSQPALWRQVRALETELGVRLFDRVGRRVRLTGPGEDLVAQGRDLLARTASLTERARTFGTGDAGVLRLGATPQTLESLAGFLARWRRAFPRVSLQLIEDGGAQILNRLEAGEVHLALAIGGDPRFHYRLLHPIHLLAVTPATHPLARRRTVEMADLVHETLLLLRPGFGSREWLDAAFRVVHARPHILVESGAPSTLIALARAGHGVAVIPSTVRFPRVGLRAVPVVHAATSLGRWLAVNWDPRRFLPPYAERFVQAVGTHAERHPGRGLGPAVPLPRPRASRD